MGNVVPELTAAKVIRLVTILMREYTSRRADNELACVFCGGRVWPDGIKHQLMGEDGEPCPVVIAEDLFMNNTRWRMEEDERFRLLSDAEVAELYGSRLRYVPIMEMYVD